MTDRRCRARTSGTGQQCKLPPMTGQEVCRKHGGKAPQNLAAARRRIEKERAMESAIRLGLPVAVDPHTALQDELHRSVGIVGGLQFALLERMAKTDDSEGLSTEAATDTGLWRALHEQRTHLAKVAKMCVDAGIAERTVRIAEAQASLIADVLRRIFEDAELGLSEDQREAARHVARRHLTSIGA